MDRRRLALIGRNTSRLLGRNGVTWLCGVVIVGIIAFLETMELSAISPNLKLGEMTLASFFPYMNAVLLSVLQVVPLVFLVKPLRGGDERVDSLEVVLTRPMGNAEYAWGVVWGFARVFLRMGLMATLVTMGIHLFASNEAPFNFWLYVFYYLTLVVPSFLFAMGVCLGVQTLLRRRVLSLTLLLVGWAVVLVEVGDACRGTFDPTGWTLTAIFSEMTGHPELGNYLLQRAGWALAGVGLIQWAVMGFRRLANDPRRRWQAKVATAVLCAGGAACVAGYAMDYTGRVEHREAYAETARKYAGMPRVTLVAEAIDYRQEGRRMEVTAEVEVENRTGKRLEEWVLWLNPGLEVKNVEADVEAVGFERENQAVVVERKIEAGERARLRVVYEGRIDEDVCYLDVPGRLYFALLQDSLTPLSRFGRRSAFLQEDYTLLTPEALWYPVATLPLNLKSPYTTSKDFARYTLTVRGAEGRTVISQGEATEEEGGVTFRNNQLLTGLSLCMGRYEKHSTVMDSVEMDLYLFKREEAYFDTICKYSDKTVEEMKRDAERGKGKAYPFDHFRLVEVPVAFMPYYRNAQGGSEDVQPEIVFFPERLVGFARVHKDIFENITISFTSNLNAFLHHTGIRASDSWLGTYLFRRVAHQFLTSAPPNASKISALFKGHVSVFQSEDYPVIEQVMQSFLKGYRPQPMPTWYSQATTLAREYLNGHSLQEGIEDEAVGLDVQQKMIEEKTMVLINYFQHRGFSLDSLQAFVWKYVNAHPFQAIDFKAFDRDFAEQFGCSWEEILPEWYTGKQIPTYIVKDYSIKALEKQDITYHTDALPDGRETISATSKEAASHIMKFTIFNDSEADGFFRVEYLAKEGDDKVEMRSYLYSLKAGTGRKISVLMPGCHMSTNLNLGLCTNLPQNWCHLIGLDDVDIRPEEYDEVVGREVLLPEENVTVVDNEDEGFSIKQQGKRLARWQAYRQQTKRASKYDNLLTFATVDDMWRTLLEYDAYGEVNRSLVTRVAGEGNTRVTWEAELKKDGWYEVLAFIPRFNYLQIIGTSGSILPEQEKQQYEVAFEGEEAQVVVAPTTEKGWVSLGIFHGEAGRGRVSLSDKGAVGKQQIIGDAVKWVFLGQEDPRETE